MSKNSLSYFIFTLLLFATAYQFSSWGIVGVTYELLRAIIIGTIILLFFVSFKNPLILFKQIPTFKIHTVCLAVFSILLLILFALGFETEFAPVRDLTLALVILAIGLNINLKEKQFIRLINIYIVLYTLAALSIVFTLGFVIYEFYLPIPKNQVAPAFGVAFILALYFSFKNIGKSKWFYLIFAALLFAALLVIRCRAVIMATFFSVFILIYFYIRSKKYRFIMVVLILITLSFIWQFIYDALFLNYDITDIDSISSGRMKRNIMGIDFIINYPLMGQLSDKFYGGIIHNYILITLVSYGVFLSTFILFIYFKYIFKIVKAIQRNSFQYYEVGPLLMVIPMFISLFEYSYPYAPGSAIFFPFFLMGQYLKKYYYTKTIR